MSFDPGYRVQNIMEYDDTSSWISIINIMDYCTQGRYYIKWILRIGLVTKIGFVTKTILLFNDDIVLIQMYQTVLIYIAICDLLIHYFN